MSDGTPDIHVLDPKTFVERAVYMSMMAQDRFRN